MLPQQLKTIEAKPVETVQTHKLKGVKDVREAAQATKLDTDGDLITCVISQHEFVIAATKDGNIRIYDQNALDAPHKVFTEHKKKICCLARLDDDLVASVDGNGQLFTWRPSTAEAIASLKLEISCDERNVLGRLDDNRLVLCNFSDVGDLAVLYHSCGTNLKLEKIFTCIVSGTITRIMVSQHLVVLCSGWGSVKILRKITFDELVSKFGDVNDIAISDEHIVMASNYERIHFYRSAPPYTLDLILEIPGIELNVAVCLNSDIVAITDVTGCVNFVSVANKSLVSRVKASFHGLTSLDVLCNGYIAVVDSDGVCTLFVLPQEVQHAINDATTDVRGVCEKDSASKQPILDAWNSVEQKTLTLIDACESVINSENTAKSLGEWCVAHNLLMQAVDTGVIPSSRDYNGIELYWHRELYRHCDTWGIGEKDTGVLISLFREAEGVGVIAEGTSESFMFALNIRKDIEKDKWYSANAIYQMFLKQAETDVRLQQLYVRQAKADAHLQKLTLQQTETDARMKQVLHYQKVQRLTSMINAVLGFVPIGGSIAANVISGGAAILNDLQVCGLVESLLGVGRELSGGFGSNKLVDLFLERGNEVLSAENWNRWGKENRKAVADAARNLGMTVEELRVRLLRATEMMHGGQANSQEGAVAEVVEVVEEGQVLNSVEHETNTTEAGNVSALAVSELNSDVERARAELARWANEPVNKESIEKLKCEDAARCLAAFLVNYSGYHAGNFVRLTDALVDIFLEQFIDGSVFVYADGREREELIQACMSAISVVAQGPGSRNLGIRLNLFSKKVLES